MMGVNSVEPKSKTAIQIEASILYIDDVANQFETTLCSLNSSCKIFKPVFSYAHVIDSAKLPRDIITASYFLPEKDVIPTRGKNYEQFFHKVQYIANYMNEIDVYDEGFKNVGERIRACLRDANPPFVYNGYQNEVRLVSFSVSEGNKTLEALRASCNQIADDTNNFFIGEAFRRVADITQIMPFPEDGEAARARALQSVRRGASQAYRMRPIQK
jgi:hypothetical protein